MNSARADATIDGAHHGHDVVAAEEHRTDGERHVQGRVDRLAVRGVDARLVRGRVAEEDGSDGGHPGEELGQPDGGDGQDQPRAVAEVAGQQAGQRAEDDGGGDAGRRGQHEGNVVGDHELDGQHGRQHADGGLGEVDDAVAAVDEDDAHGQDGVDGAVDDPEEHDAEGQALGQEGGQEYPDPDGPEEPAQGGAGRAPQRGAALTQAAVDLARQERALLRVVTLPRHPPRPEASRGAADHLATSHVHATPQWSRPDGANVPCRR